MVSARATRCCNIEPRAEVATSSHATCSHAVCSCCLSLYRTFACSLAHWQLTVAAAAAAVAVAGVSWRPVATVTSARCGNQSAWRIQALALRVGAQRRNESATVTATATETFSQINCRIITYDLRQPLLSTPAALCPSPFCSCPSDSRRQHRPRL